MIEVSPSFREDTARFIQKSTTGLIKLTHQPGKPEKAIHIGAGTFVRIGNHYGILTAQHVASELNEPCLLGLTIDSQIHRYEVQSQLIKRIDYAERKTDEFGPDISLLILPPKDGVSISNYMNFFSMSSHQPRMLSKAPSMDSGWWLICGTPEAGTREETSIGRYSRVLALEHFACEGVIGAPVYMNGLDFVDMEIDFSIYMNSPHNFKGMSGGGLWQVLFREKLGQLEVASYVLSGVVFYQSELVDGKRSIRSHFRETLYAHAYPTFVQGLGEQDLT